jgi:hypothetical protein
MLRKLAPAAVSRILSHKTTVTWQILFSPVANCGFAIKENRFAGAKLERQVEVAQPMC